MRLVQHRKKNPLNKDEKKGFLYDPRWTAIGVVLSAVIGIAAIASPVFISWLSNLNSGFPPYIRGEQGSLLFADSLAQADDHWREAGGNQDAEKCRFENSAYHAIEQNLHKTFFCPSTIYSLRNFTLEVRMRIVSGNCGGIAFGSDPQEQHYYAFEICSDETYHLYPPQNVDKNHQPSGHINRPSEENLLAIHVQGGKIDLYVNTVFVNTLTDDNYHEGGLGLYAHAHDTLTDIAFSDVKVWQLS